MDECTRPSLGQMAKIGSLYDVRTEKLLISTVFNDNIDKFVETEISDGIFSDSFLSTKTSEKLRKLEIDANASLSLLCGIIKASGTVNFVDNMEYSERAVQCNIVVQKTTKKEHLNYKQSKLREYFELSGHEHATHVVVGITWGANAIITYTDSNINGHQKNKVSGKMKVELQKLQTVCPNLGDITAEVDVKANDDNHEWKGAETKLKVYTDITSNKKLPNTIDEAKEFIEDMSKSDKVGKQQMFHLLPIDSLKSFLQMNTSSISKFSTINNSRILKIESLFDEFDETYGKMKDNVEDINKTSSIPLREKNLFQKHLQNMANEISTIKESVNGLLRDEIRELVLKVRTTEENPTKLDEKYNYIQDKSIASRSNLQNFLDENNAIIERAKFLREFEEKGVKTAGNKNRLNEIKRNNINKNIYIMYCSFERDQNSERINTFCKLINERKPQDCFVVVESDSWEGDEIPQTATIQLIVDGILVDADYNPNTRYLTKKDFALEELESILKISGSYECDYTNVVIQASCCVEVDNFTRETLYFVGYQEQHGWFIFETKDKNISPGYRFVFHTQKQKMSLYGVAVMCAWKYQNTLIAASWQVPLSSAGGLNSICFGITKPGVTFEQISQTVLEGLLDKKQGLVDDYFEGGKKSGLFTSIKKRTFKKGIESESVKDNDISVSVRMTATSTCNLSIQIHPRNVNNYAQELLKHVSI